MADQTTPLAALVRDCQSDLARWIVPDSGISDRDVISQLLARLDGPQARDALAAEDRMRAALVVIRDRAPLDIQRIAEEALAT